MEAAYEGLERPFKPVFGVRNLWEAPDARMQHLFLIWFLLVFGFPGSAYLWDFWSVHVAGFTSSFVDLQAKINKAYRSPTPVPDTKADGRLRSPRGGKHEKMEEWLEYRKNPAKFTKQSGGVCPKGIRLMGPPNGTGQQSTHTQCAAAAGFTRHDAERRQHRNGSLGVVSALETLLFMPLVAHSSFSLAAIACRQKTLLARAVSGEGMHATLCRVCLLPIFRGRIFGGLRSEKRVARILRLSQEVIEKGLSIISINEIDSVEGQNELISDRESRGRPTKF